MDNQDSRYVAAFIGALDSLLNNWSRLNFHESIPPEALLVAIMLNLALASSKQIKPQLLKYICNDLDHLNIVERDLKACIRKS
jgi:hypothetical protein